MQSTSEIWKTLAAADGTYVEAKAIINGVEYTDIEPPVITRALMQNGLEVGNVVSAMCSLTLDANETIPKSADARIFARLSGGKAANVTVDITPVQSGSGDPSPTNVRPISGWTGANMTRCGKNLFDPQKVIDAGGTFDGTKYNATQGILQNMPLSYIKFAPNEQYYFYAIGKIDSSNTNGALRVKITYTDATVEQKSILFADAEAAHDVYSNANKSIATIEFSPYGTISANKNYFKEFLICKASYGTKYEPYTGTTYSISWQSEAGTVYGGTLDVTTGLLTVTHGNIASYNGESLPGKWISSMDVYSAGGTPTTGAQVVYELATPQTYQLTPTQIALLAGENNVWADCGDVTWYVSDEPLHSEWLPQGLFYISKRIRDPNTNIQHFECYDTLLRSNVIWTPASSTWPQETEDILDEILAAIGLQLDPRTSIVSYPISEPIPGTTMRDILSLIAQHNGGNWIVTPENKLRLVPIVDLGGAEEADTIVDVDAVVGSYYVGETKTISGIRFPVDDATSIVGDETGAVVTVSIPGVIVTDLAETLIGKSYKPFMFGTAYYDMAAELGDYVQADDIISVLYAETITLGAVMHGDIAAPDIAEIDDEYPYVSNSQKTVALAKAAVNEAIEQFDDDLTQQEIFNRLTDNGAAQGLVLYNGELYVNASYIQSGTLVLGAVNNERGTLHVLDAFGNLIGKWDNNGISINTLLLDAIRINYTNPNYTDSYLKLGTQNSPLYIRVNDSIHDRSVALHEYSLVMTEVGTSRSELTYSGLHINRTDPTASVYPNISLSDNYGSYSVGDVEITLNTRNGFNMSKVISVDEHGNAELEATVLIEEQGAYFSGALSVEDAATTRMNLGITPATIGAVSKAGDTMTGPLTVTGADILQTAGYIKGDIEDYPNHAIKLGHYADNVMQFLEYGGQFDFYQTLNGTYKLLFQVKDGVSAKPLPVNNGGTGATSESGARSNLKVPYSPGSTTVSSFSQIPTEAGFYMVTYAGTDPDAPITTSDYYWWNVIQIGVASRLVQIANNAYLNRNKVFMRVKHDSTWYGWFKFEGTHV